MPTENLVIMVAAIAFAIVVFALVAIKWRNNYRSGIGPPVQSGGPWTMGGKRRLNRYYSSHDWPKPYDDQGNYVSEADRKAHAEPNS